MPLARVWLAWTSPTVTGDLARRREAVLLELLASLIVVGLLAQTSQWVSPLYESTDPEFLINWLATLSTTLAFYGLLRLARHGRHRTASWGLVGLFAVLGVWLLTAEGVQQPIWPFLYALTTVLAALLLGSREALAVLFAQMFALLVVWYADPLVDWLPWSPAGAARGVTIGNLLAPLLLLLVTARSCHLYTREQLTSVDEILSHDAERSPLQRLRTKALTMREIEVVQLVAEGLSNDEIAARLFVSPRTVQSHIANAMGKTSTPNRTALGVLAIREGLAPLDHPSSPEGEESSIDVGAGV